VELTSVTADGDAAIHLLVEKHFGDSVVTNCDPNHYAKGLANNVKNLCASSAALTAVAEALKQHFLIGMCEHTCCVQFMHWSMLTLCRGEDAFP
jgi:hypothetical protein